MIIFIIDLFGDYFYLIYESCFRPNCKDQEKQIDQPFEELGPNVLSFCLKSD